MKNNKVHAFWNSRAGLGPAAGTKDLNAKKLEIESIAKYVRDGMRVLDVGCGNGTTALEIASRFNIHVEGIDFAEEMISEAATETSRRQLMGTVSFQVGNILNLPKNLGKFDLIYTERSLINLASWQEQKQAIEDICQLLIDGGIYVMCENSQNGLNRINEFRKISGLNKIDLPWHNRYILDSEVEQCTIPGIKLETVEYFSATYYFLSRVVNAWLAEQQGLEPDYDAPINRLALKLPPIGDLAQTRIWLWRKISD